MKLTIAHQERYARDQLILRTLFGWLYIGVPHVLLLLFVGVWSLILCFVIFWIALFTERFPRGIFDRQVEYPEKLRWWLVLLRFLFGLVYVGIPHGICLLGRSVATLALMFLAWWAVLITLRYPARWHAFNVGTFRWLLRVVLYLGFFTEEYPRFSGNE